MSRALVLGGTNFVGRHLVQTLLAQGHQVAIFHRGSDESPDTMLFADVEHLHGDRRGDATVLGGRSWDVVYDVSAYLPVDVRTTSAQLRGAVGHYVFISTISVYADFSVPGIEEDSPVHDAGGPEALTTTPESYGPMKVRCEQLIGEEFASASVIRPGIIAGPYDSTDRFTYWCLRGAQPGAHIAPGHDRALQVIDARDLAAFVVRCGEQGLRGTFNVAGVRVGFYELLEASVAVSGADVTWQHLSPQECDAQGIEAWRDLPLVLPSDDLSHRHQFSVDSSRAVAAGLHRRPLIETVRDTQAWALENRGPDMAVGLTLQREAQLLVTPR